MYYFGCTGEDRGHYMYDVNMSRDWKFLYNNPWSLSIDSELCPKGKENFQGRSSLHHKNGWTALSFWDRSGDIRQGSNSSFLSEGLFTFSYMVDSAKRAFPDCFKRFNFTLIEDLEP